MVFGRAIAARAVVFSTLLFAGLPLVASAGIFDQMYPGSTYYVSDTGTCPSYYANYNSCPSGIGGLFGAQTGYGGGYGSSYSSGYAYAPTYQQQSYYPSYQYQQPQYSYYTPPQTYYYPPQQYYYQPSYDDYGYYPQTVYGPVIYY